MESWRARLGLLASRGETDGPRVAEARYALSWWRTRSFLIREMNVTLERAEVLLDQIDADADQADTDTDAAEVVASA